MGMSSNNDPLIAAAESWPIRAAEVCRLIRSKHPLPTVNWTNQLGQTLLHIVSDFFLLVAKEMIIICALQGMSNGRCGSC